ncbi:hypothetical protein FQA39_LY03443 [Lamprigera yunnana]|nr:hypothetical protein FQA39_LY03443 [Lamprigera yunnana]
MSTEVDPKIIQSTQEVLGKFIKKPPLTEKLLKKPPFRFLHDVITNIIRETGFLKGLYNERELVSENVKEKEEKLAFLNKIIEATKAITEIDLAVRPTKIIAGFEPHNTNLFLQAIGTALEKNLDSSEYINSLKVQKPSKNKENAKEVKPKTTKSKEKISKTPSQNLPSKPSTTNLQRRVSVASKESKTSNDIKTVKKPKTKVPISIKQTEEPEIANNLLQSDSKSNLENEGTITSEANTTVKENDTNNLGGIKPHFPPTPSTPIDEVVNRSDVETEKVKSKKIVSDIEKITTTNIGVEIKEKGSVEIEDKDEVPVKKLHKMQNPVADEAELFGKSSESILESPYPLDNKTIIKPSGRPKSSIRPVSVRPSSARPGAPRLQKSDTIIVKDKDIIPLGKVNVIDENSANDFADEEETVTTETTAELEIQAMPIDLLTDKGHLVEQILQQINTSDFEPTKTNVNVEWEQAGLRNRNSVIKEVDQVRGAIQELTKMVNPLGKLINYLHEDLEAMHCELDMWNDCIRQTMIEIANQKKVTDESNMPLQIKLEEVEENISKYQQQILSTYSNIIRNEERIEDLLAK